MEWEPKVKEAHAMQESSLPVTYRLKTMEEVWHWWLNDQKHGIWKRILQAENIVQKGWTVYSHRVIDLDVLAYEASKVLGFPVGLRYKAVHAKIQTPGSLSPKQTGLKRSTGKLLRKTWPQPASNFQSFMEQNKRNFLVVYEWDISRELPMSSTINHQPSNKSESRSTHVQTSCLLCSPSERTVLGD